MVFLLDCVIAQIMNPASPGIKTYRTMETYEVSFSVTAASLKLAHQKAPGIVEKIMQEHGWNVIVNKTRILDPEEKN